jgi:hypothetical protein
MVYFVGVVMALVESSPRKGLTLDGELESSSAEHVSATEPDRHRGAVTRGRYLGMAVQRISKSRQPLC